MQNMMRWLMGLMLLPLVVATATTIHVPADQPTIQAGIDAAFDDDTVLVAEGTYFENLIVDNKEITLLSESGPEVTTLSPASTPNDVLIYTNNSGKVNKVYGFKFTGVNALHAIELMNGKMIVEDCHFVDNVLEGEIGGAVMVWEQAEIRNCVFENNKGGVHGGGIRWVNSGGGIIVNCEFRNNSATYGGGIDLLYGDNVVVRYNLFVADTAAALGGALYLGSADAVQLINNTVDGCYSSDARGGGFALNASLGLTVINNVIVNCGGFGVWENGTCTGAIDYNDCFSNTPDNYNATWLAGANSISADPRFVGSAPLSYHLTYYSPCINAGNPDPSFNDPDGSRNDMGAFPGGVGSLPIAANLGFGADATEGFVTVPFPTIYWHYLDTSSSPQTQYEIEVGTDSDWTVVEMWQSGAVASADTSALYAGVSLSARKLYYLRIRVSRSVGWGEWLDYSFSTRIGGATEIHVPTDFPTIQLGIDAASDNDTVLVAPGIYSENLVVDGKQIVLRSEAGRSATTLMPATTPGDVLQYLNCNDKLNRVCGFKFTGVNGLHAIDLGYGKAFVEECQFVDNVLSGEIGGAVMVWFQAEIRNCTFENNKGGIHGGAIRWTNHGGGIIEGCTFINNASTYGGAIDLLYSSGVVVKRNLFVADSAEALGGAIYLANAYENAIINNTFSSCVAVSGSGGALAVNSTDQIVILNNILTGCVGYGIWSDNASRTSADYNDVYINSPADYYDPTLAGANSLSDDPHFVGGVPYSYHIAAGSPCINRGNPDPAYNDPDGTRNDIGAFYYHNTPLGAFELLLPSNQFDSSVLTLTPTFSWQVPPDPDSGDVATYSLVLATDSAFVFAIERAGSGQPQYTLDLNLSWKTRYWWKVKATDPGGASVWSTSVFKFRTLRRGDANDDGDIDISDPVFLLNYIFMGGSTPRSIALADANCDGKLDISDAVYMILYIFAGGQPPCVDELP